MMKMAAVFSKQARAPMETSVSVKGDKMAHRTATHLSIIDLSAETITSVDLQKKTYTVMTFEQMKQMMRQMQESMQRQQKQNPDPNAPAVSFKVSINGTGATKQVAGIDTKETLIKMEMQGTDQQSGQSGSMVVTLDEWVAPEVPGYGEVREFYKRMGAKIDWGGAGNMFASRPDVAKGMAEARKQAANLEGTPVLSVMAMTGASSPDGTAQAQPADQPAPRPSLGGLLGAGIGVKRKKTDSNAPADSGAPGSLLEMTTELSGFSREAVDDAQFAVPRGFKKIEMKGMQ
jgi:hypothetical protein